MVLKLNNTKICIKCGIEKDLSNFYKAKTRDKLTKKCKPCYIEDDKERNKQYYIDNREKILKRKREYDKTNPNRIGKCRNKEKDRIRKARVRKEKRPETGWTYIIRAEKYVKIGHTKNEEPSLGVNSRLSNIKVGLPFPDEEIEILFVENGGHKREFELHELFAKDRVRKTGEWFYFSEDIKKYINNPNR